MPSYTEKVLARCLLRIGFVPLDIECETEVHVHRTSVRPCSDIEAMLIAPGSYSYHNRRPSNKLGSYFRCSGEQKP